MNADPANNNNNDNVKLEEEVISKIQPFLEKLKGLEESIGQKDEELVVLKLAYEKLLEEASAAQKSQKKK